MVNMFTCLDILLQAEGRKQFFEWRRLIIESKYLKSMGRFQKRRRGLNLRSDSGKEQNGGYW